MNLPVDNYEVVYVAIKSLDSGNSGQIISIAAKFEYGDGFQTWIKPALSSARSTFQVQGLKVSVAGLFYENRKLPTEPQVTALKNFLDFLKKASKPVVLVGHCTQVVYALLLRAILKTNLVDEFHSVIAGLADSRPAFMKKYSAQGTKREEDFELNALARDVLRENYTEQFLLAANRLRIIEKLVSSAALRDTIVRNAIPFESAALQQMEVQYSPAVVRNLVAMRGVLTLGMLKKLAQAGVSFDGMMEIHQHVGSKGLMKVLSKKGNDGKPIVTANVKILKSIADFFDAREPPAPEELFRDRFGREVYTIQYPTYRQEQERLEKSRKVYREIVKGKNNQPLYEVEYTD